MTRPPTDDYLLDLTHEAHDKERLHVSPWLFLILFALCVVLGAVISWRCGL